MEPYEAYEILKNEKFIDDLSDAVTPLYAEVMKGRWKEVEEYIKKDPCLAFFYARDVIKGRWPEAEEYIKTDPFYAFDYAHKVIKGRWLEAEPYIKTDVPDAYAEHVWGYAEHVMKCRWPEAEDIIKKYPTTACEYALEVIKGRFPEAEEYIKTDPFYAYKYARDVIKGRWPEAEEIIKTDPKSASYYAKNVMNDENFWEKRERELALNDPLKSINEIHQSRVKEQERKIEQERERERQELARLQNIADKHQRLKDWLQKIESVVDEYNIDVSSLIPNQDQDFDEIEIKENITKYVGQNIPVMVTTTDTNYTPVD